MGLGQWNKAKMFAMMGLSLLAVGVTSISTLAWFQIQASTAPETTVMTNGMSTDAFVYQNEGRSYDDRANKGPETDPSGTLTYDHSQGQTATPYYIVGQGSRWDGIFTAESALQMYKNPNNPDDRGAYWKISLAVGDKFKIYNSVGAFNVQDYWYGYSSISNSCTLKGTNFTDSSTNIQVAVAGVYDIFVSIQNVIYIQYHSDTRFTSDTTNEIGYLIVGKGSEWKGNYDMGEGISMTINKRSDSQTKDLAMYAGLRLAVNDSFRIVDGSSSQDDPTYYPTDDSDSNLAPRTSGAADTAYFSYSATNNQYTFTCETAGYYCIYLNGSSAVNIQLWDGRATDGTTYYTRGSTKGNPQTESRASNGDRLINQPKGLSTNSTSETIYFKDATWWGGSDADSYGTRVFMWNSSSTRRVYVNVSACTWYNNDSCVAYISSDKTGGQRGTETSTGSKIYYADIAADSTKIWVGRSTGGDWYNTVDVALSAKDTYNVNSGCTSISAAASSTYCDYSANNGDFPGVVMTRVTPASQSSTVPNYYRYTYNARQYDKVIFSRWSSNNDMTDAQTVDITLSASGSYNMYDISGTSATWLNPGNNKVTGAWGTYSQPSGITLTFDATYGTSHYTPSNVTIAYGGSGTVPSFTSQFGYTSPTTWSNGTDVLTPGDTITYTDAAAFASNSFTASYTMTNSTYYLDLYDLKYNNISGFGSSPEFRIYAWVDASTNKEYGKVGDTGFPASEITSGVIHNVSGQTGYDANAAYDYRKCFWTVTLPESVVGYIVYTGSNIGSATWKSNDISTSSGNLAIVKNDRTVSYKTNCTGAVHTVTTTKVMDGDETPLYKYNAFNKVSWNVPAKGSSTGYSSKWYSNKNGTGGTEYEVGQSITVDGNKNVYEVFSRNIYKLTKTKRIFRNGTYKTQQSGGDQDLVYNTATSITAVTYSGATFAGWYSDEACTQLLSNSTTFNYTIGAAATTIFAKFNLNTATLRGTYTYYNGASIAKTSTSQTTVYVGDSLTVSSNAVRNTTANAQALASGLESGYFHEGWYSNDTMTTSWTSQTVAAGSAGGTINLYAKLSTAKLYLYGSTTELGNWNYANSNYSAAISQTTITFSNVSLAKGVELKTYSPRGNNGQLSFPTSATASSVTGTAISNGFIDLDSGNEYNMRVQLAGTYTFTVTVDTANYNVSAISVAATALDASNFTVDFASGSNPAARADLGYSASGNVFTVAFHAFIGDKFRFKADFYTSSDSYVKPSITKSGGGDFDGLIISGDYIRCNIDATITMTFTANLSTYGSSTCAVTTVQEYNITYAIGEHAEFDTATYFIQAADNNTFSEGVLNTVMHYPTDTTNYHAAYTGYTLSFSQNKNVRYMRVLRRVSNSTGSADSQYQTVFDIGATYPSEGCAVDWNNDIYTFTKEYVLDIKVHKTAGNGPYLEVAVSQATTHSATTHYNDIYIIGLGKPGSDLRVGDYTLQHGLRMNTYGGNTSNFPAYYGNVEYTADTFAEAASDNEVGTALTLMKGDTFTLTDGVDTFGPSANGTGYTVDEDTVTITQSAQYYIWATATNAVNIAQKSESVISDGRTAGDLAVDGLEDWKQAPLSYSRGHGARVLNASGMSLNFGGKLDYALLDGCHDGYYHFYIELRNTSPASSGTVTYGFDDISIPTGTKIKYKNATQTGSLKSGFNAATVNALANETALSDSITITNTVTANENGFAGSTVIEVMIPISQIATAATFDFAFSITVSYEESI